MPTVILTSPEGNARLERWLEGDADRVLTPVRACARACEKVQKILCLKQISWGSEFHSLTTCLGGKQTSKLSFYQIYFSQKFIPLAMLKHWHLQRESS